MKLNLEQNTTEWLSWRYSRIGGSDAATILGLNPWKTPASLLVEKLYKVPTKVTAAMNFGTKNETTARNLYNATTNINFEPACFEHDQYTFLASSMDGVCEELRLGLEIKCPMSNFDNHKTAMKGMVPKQYYPQCQHNLFVTGYEHLHYVSFWKNSVVPVLVKPDLEFLKILLEKELEFYDTLKREMAGTPSREK